MKDNHIVHFELFLGQQDKGNCYQVHHCECVWFYNNYFYISIKYLHLSLIHWCHLSNLGQKLQEIKWRLSLRKQSDLLLGYRTWCVPHDLTVLLDDVTVSDIIENLIMNHMNPLLNAWLYSGGRSWKLLLYCTWEIYRHLLLVAETLYKFEQFEFEHTPLYMFNNVQAVHAMITSHDLHVIPSTH